MFLLRRVRHEELVRLLAMAFFFLSMLAVRVASYESFVVVLLLLLYEDSNTYVPALSVAPLTKVAYRQIPLPGWNTSFRTDTYLDWQNLLTDDNAPNRYRAAY